MMMETRMSPNARAARLPWLAAVLGITTVATAGCASSDGSEATAQEGGPTPGNGARVLNVEVEPVTLTRFVDYIRITGEVEALHDVSMDLTVAA